MPQVVTCPQCAQRLNIPDTFRGARAKCPKCAGAIELAPPAPPPPAPPEPTDSSSPEESVTSTPTRRDVEKPQASGVSLGLGIGSLVVGILSFLLALIPCLGIFAVPVAAIGLLLGIAGAVVAFTRGGAGLGFPIAGGAVNLVAVIIAIAWFVGARYLATNAAQNAANQMAKQIENMDMETQMPIGTVEEPNPNQVWTKAPEAIDMGDARVKVVSVKVSTVPLQRIGGPKRNSNNEHLIVTLSIENRSPNRPLHYQSWGSFPMNNSAYVRDSAGSLLNRVQFGGLKIDGQADSMPIIQAGSSIKDILVFSKPRQGFTHLRLGLPGQSIRGNGYLRFEIPAEMVQE